MTSFELRRGTDSLLYRFHRAERCDGLAGYRREDLDVGIVQSPTLGWIAIDDATGAVIGRPWDVPPEQQSDQPPEGDWVSKKGDKSYVYELRSLPQ